MSEIFFDALDDDGKPILDPEFAQLKARYMKSLDGKVGTPEEWAETLAHQEWLGDRISQLEQEVATERQVVRLGRLWTQALDSVQGAVEAFNAGDDFETAQRHERIMHESARELLKLSKLDKVNPTSLRWIAMRLHPSLNPPAESGEPA